MARILSGSENEVFRAVVTVKFKDGSTSVRHRGPFLAKGQAATAIKRLKSEAKHYGWTWWLGADTEDVESIEGLVERSSLDWRPVTKNPEGAQK